MGGPAPTFSRLQQKGQEFKEDTWRSFAIEHIVNSLTLYPILILAFMAVALLFISLRLIARGKNHMPT